MGEYLIIWIFLILIKKGLVLDYSTRSILFLHIELGLRHLILTKGLYLSVIKAWYLNFPSIGIVPNKSILKKNSKIFVKILYLVYKSSDKLSCDHSWFTISKSLKINLTYKKTIIEWNMLFDNFMKFLDNWNLVDNSLKFFNNSNFVR